MKTLKPQYIGYLATNGLKSFVMSFDGLAIVCGSDVDYEMEIADVLEDIEEAKIRLDEVVKQLRTAQAAFTK